MKNLLKTFAYAIVVSTCYNCTTESVETSQDETLIIQEEIVVFEELDDVCTSQNPQAVLTNNSLLSVDFEVFDHFGILMTHAYGVPAGAVSPILTFPDGVVTFIVSTSASTKEIKIDMGDCMIYQVEIDENNQLDTDVPTQL